MNCIKKRIILSLCFCFLTTGYSIYAAVTLPKIFSDNMVLQRDKNLKVWGWADSGESIKVEFNGQTVKTKASKSGAWVVTLKPMTHGGPFQMVITGKSDKITFKNVLIGDVWLGSGQSNMEWLLTNTHDAQNEIPKANYPKIRLFTVEKVTSFTPEKDVQGGPWLECTPKNAETFSAVAYYFGKRLQEELDIPIGLINSSWGGTKIEPWISWEYMSQEEEYKNISVDELSKTAEENKKNQARYAEAVTMDKGMKEKWFDPSVASSGWNTIEVPKEWGGTVLGNVDGVVWFKREFEIPASAVNSKWTLSLGPIDDIDVTFINGVEVGTMPAWDRDRFYELKSGVLKPGKNTVVVKVIDSQGGGGLYGKPEQLYLDNGATRISLAGQWLYNKAAVTSDFNIKDTGPNSFGSLLYNAMIAPIVQYPVRGVIWYQGESNAGAAYKYRRLFPTLIKDWRSKWGYEFPFYWVQLANFMATSNTPSESAWAELREAQHMTLAVPKTGEAVIIDIGEANDIHPRNKRDVGSRLALNALAREYSKQIAYAGPEYKSFTVDGNQAVITFLNTDKGLVSHNDKYGYLRGFAIAGEDKKFVWAKAYIKGDQVIVYSDAVKNPVAIRYAWGDNPDDANLYNTAGLPASPFRTDQWKGVTEANGK